MPTNTDTLGADAADLDSVAPVTPAPSAANDERPGWVSPTSDAWLLYYAAAEQVTATREAERLRRAEVALRIIRRGGALVLLVGAIIVFALSR